MSLSKSMLKTEEYDRFKQSVGPELFETLTIFPLWGMDGTGRCLCSRDSCNTAGKHPTIKWGPNDFKDHEKIYQRKDGAGVGLGLATGSRSGLENEHIVVIDVDAKQNGPESLKTLESRLGPLPPTLRVSTPSGGFHLYFWSPGRFKSTAGVLAPGVDTRAEGGYVVLPGSPHKSGGHYAVQEALKPAMLPPRWVDSLPRAGAPRAALRAPVETTAVDTKTLRERLAETSAGRRGDGWTSWRQIVKGERAFRLDGGPGGPELPVAYGVDEYLNKRMIWALVSADPWHTVPGVDMGALVAPSLALLRDDAAGLGTPSKWTPEHFAARWDAAALKAGAEHEQLMSLQERLLRARDARDLTLEALDQATLPPPVVQIGKHYWILNDATEHYLYKGRKEACEVVGSARQLWGPRRDTEVPTKGGTRRMNPTELMEAHGAHADYHMIDYSASRPRVSDWVLIEPPVRLDRPPPKLDLEVARWLHLLDPSDEIVKWIAHASPERTREFLTALVLVGATAVGKSFFARCLAVAAGQNAPGSLAGALSRFAGDVLPAGPVLLGDEGVPRNSMGVPLTEELRALLTSQVHLLEVKGVSKRMHILGNVRVVMSANRFDRLFSAGKGQYSSDDIDAIVRRLTAVEVYEPEHAQACQAAVQSLGSSPMDPARVLRVAGHMRYLQTLDLPTPAPRAGSVPKNLRVGSDQAKQALEALEDAIHSAADWVATDDKHVWARAESWGRACGQVSHALTRHLAAYITRSSHPYSKHPITQITLPNRQRWVRLDRTKLQEDGIDV